LIEVEGLTKRYGNFMAVDNATFRVESGHILGFLGPNGAGKTTTMRILTCFLPPTGGTARVAGFDVQTESMDVRKRLGYLPENPPLYDDMTVVEYIDFAAHLKGIPRQKRANAVDVAVGRCGLGDRRKQIIGTLSKGYRQRTGLAQAIVHEPAVLILDEPTIGLDPAQIIEIRELIKGFSNDHTVILSTHILPEVSVTCDSVAIIHEGRIRLVESMDSLNAAGNESLEEVFLRVISTDEVSDQPVDDVTVPVEDEGEASE
jgi:ABC-2 type transport system ATP-binding protein